MIDQVLLASPRGFCAGVDMAIKALTWMIQAFDPPVYCYHEIIHNQKVVKRFEDAGVVFVDDIGEVPPGSPIMLSAHGSAPEVEQAAPRPGRLRRGRGVPLVTKVTTRSRTRAAKGYQIVYVGHEGHEEAVGTMAVAPEAIHRVDNARSVAALPEFKEPVAVLAQTTLSHREWEGVLEYTRRRFPDLWQPSISDLCFATTNRQTAMMEIAPECDAVLVIGSANSSNTQSLVDLAAEAGARRVLRINDADDVPHDLEGTIGVTAGASAPEDLVRGVIERLAPAQGVREVTVIDEDEYFPPPRNLRELLASVEAAALVSLGAGTQHREPLNDRLIDASDLLDKLSARPAV